MCCVQLPYFHDWWTLKDVVRISSPDLCAQLFGFDWDPLEWKMNYTCRHWSCSSGSDWWYRCWFESRETILSIAPYVVSGVSMDWCWRISFIHFFSCEPRAIAINLISCILFSDAEARLRKATIPKKEGSWCVCWERSIHATKRF